MRTRKDRILLRALVSERTIPEPVLPAEATEQGEEVVCGDYPDIGRLKRQRAASRRLALDIGTAMETAYSYGEPGYRWLSADTIIPDETDPEALNRYAYTLNNPLKYQDPSGHIVIPTAVTAFLLPKEPKPSVVH